jgi:hypothetical protein
MAKGIFTQGVCVLTDGTPKLDEIAAALEAIQFEIVKRSPEQKDWRFGGPTVVVDYRPEVNGYIAVDVVNQPWPDSMGDPKGDPLLFGAWSMGQFGPLTFPGGLARAAQHNWSWEPARTIAQQHRGFIRLRLSYGFGAASDAPLMPQDCDPLDELDIVCQAAMALLALPGVICYYNPNGEVLRDRASFCETWKACAEEEKLPFLLWSNIRFFHLSPSLRLMDTVGNGQFDRPDIEAVFPHDKYDPGDVDYYLRNVTQYVYGLERELQSGEEIDGPGESNLGWTIEASDAVAEPPRRVLRLYPKANAAEVKQALAGVKGS